MKKLPLILSLAALLFGFALEAGAETTLTLESPRLSSSSEMRRHAFTMELLGRGGLYSFNYDFMLNDDIALGGGIASYSLSSGSANASAWVLPLYANYYFNQGQHRVFASGGANMILVSGNVSGDTQIKGSGLAGVIGAGYEYRGEDGFLFRATPYVFVGKASGGWIGFTLGYSI
jgi:hypothetical protein